MLFFENFDNKCYEECPTGTRVNGDECEKCDVLICDKCPTSKETCEACQNKYKLYNNECISQCQIGTKEMDNECIDCKIGGCAKCEDDINTCNECKNGYTHLCQLFS